MQLERLSRLKRCAIRVRSANEARLNALLRARHAPTSNTEIPVTKTDACNAPFTRGNRRRDGSRRVDTKQRITIAGAMR